MNETHVDERGHAERAGGAVVKTALQTACAVGVPARRSDRSPERPAAQDTVKVRRVYRLRVHLQQT